MTAVLSSIRRPLAVTRNALPALRQTVVAAALAASLSIGLAAFAVDATADSGPPLQGVFADNFSLSPAPVPAPEVTVQTPDGEASTADFRGRVVLLNFWATWCGPCVHEMPSLDRLQADLGPAGLTVMAVSEDRKMAQIEAFYAEQALTNLGSFLDRNGALARAHEIGGLPTTMLIDREGNVVGTLQGAAEWDSAEAKALISYYLDQEPELIRTGG